MKLNRILPVIAMFALTLAVSSANAQGNLRYQNQYSKSQVSQTINRVENSSRSFRTAFDRALDQSNLNGTPQEDQYNRYVGDFANSLTRLRSDFNSNRQWWNVRNQAQDVLSRAQTVNQMMNNLSFRRNIERQWATMRNDLNSLADTFDLAGLDGGGWNGGGWNGNGGNWGGGNWGGNQISTPPTWAQGTFYATAPDGSGIVLNISNNGQVTATIGGSQNYGRFYNNMLYINGATARVQRSGNGIRTTRTDNGEAISYSRDGWNNGGWGWGNGTGIGNGNGTGWGNGNGGNNGWGNSPVNWAVGTFVGTNPNNGGPIYLTIENNGRVSANIGGGMSYGTLSGSTLTINGETATLQRSGNGFATVSNNTGQRIEYRRR